MFKYEDAFKDKKNILFVMAHPDDVVVFYGALINKLRKDNKNIYVLTVTNGARGSRENVISEEELAKQRLAEEILALKSLGVSEENFKCLNYKDGEVESNLKLIGEISRFVRKYKIDVLCTHEPTSIYNSTYAKDGFFINHRDHRHVGEATIDAAYPFSRDRSFFPEQIAEGLEPRSVFDVIVTDEIQSNFEIDYTSELETKRTALLEHKSQFNEEVVAEILGAVKNGDKYVEKYFYIKLLW